MIDPLVSFGLSSGFAHERSPGLARDEERKAAIGDSIAWRNRDPCNESTQRFILATTKQMSRPRHSDMPTVHHGYGNNLHACILGS